MTRSLLEILHEQFPDSSKTTLRKMLQTDRVRVNGTIERNAKRIIGSADRVETVSKKEISDPRVAILYEDDDLIVINDVGKLPAALIWLREESYAAELAQQHLTDMVNFVTLDRHSIVVIERNVQFMFFHR